MPDISLLQPAVLRGVVEKFTTPEDKILLNRLPSTPWPYPVAQWDVIKGSRQVAAPNVPNSEAHVVPRLGRSTESASFIYLREKKVFEPTTLHWIRTPGEAARVNAEAAVMREITDLNTRFDNFAELVCWKALSGIVALDYPDVQASVSMAFPATHTNAAGAGGTLANPTVGWSTATAGQVTADVRAYKRLISRDGRVPARTAFATELTLAKIFDAFVRAGATTSSGAYPLGGLLSDRMKDQYFSSGVLPGFLGLDWVTTEAIYDDSSGNPTLFLKDNAIIFANLDEGRPMEMLVGPTADDDAPEGFTGKFSKTWKDKDPSARQYLMEWNILPVITRPEQVVYVDNVG